MFEVNIDFGLYASDISRSLNMLSKPLTVLFFGIQGACKSSTINTWFKMLKRDPRFSIANSGAHFGPTTVRLASYICYQAPNLRIIDTWGETTDNYRNEEFSKMLSGKMPIGYHISQSENNFNGKFMGVPDCVVFFTTVQSVDERAWTDKLATHISAVTMAGISYVVLLTKVDEVDPILEQNPDEASSILDGYKRNLAAKIGMAPNRVDHTVNYHLNETQLDFNKDRHAYVLMRKVIEFGMQHALVNLYDDTMC